VILRLAAGLLAAALIAPSPARAARPLSLGFLDVSFASPDGAAWLQRASAAGADQVRINVGWPVPDTPQRPAGFDARDPGSPVYDFTAADQAIRVATARGMRVLASFTGAPRWAEGPNMPADATPGSWRPDPQALEDYGAALARRYSGTFPDPLNPGATLPKVAAFQAWNEPNLGKYLSPQWAGGQPASPGLYRALLNAFYDGVKSAGTNATVVTAGTAPFGDPQPGGARLMPLRFWRDLLAGPTHFDVLAHHPYSVGTPTAHALNADDVSIPDIGRISRVLRAAERRGTALPKTTHPIWVTEVSYDSGPPDPDGVPLTKHAGFLELSLYELWRQGVSAIFWFQVGDEPPDPSYAATNQSGVYFLDGRPKPALRAYRFPLVALREHGAVQVWGRAPAAGKLQIQRHEAGGWRTIRQLTVNDHFTFLTHVTLKGAATLRARLGADTSLGWKVH
jgi:hypothetical protein